MALDMAEGGFLRYRSRTDERKRQSLCGRAERSAQMSSRISDLFQTAQLNGRPDTPEAVRTTQRGRLDSEAYGPEA